MTGSGTTKPGLPERLRDKAVIYATCDGKLLVFREPAFPDLGLQPPGGTIERSETISEGAARELQEEAGVKIEPAALHLLGSATYRYQAGGMQHVHHRSFFHVSVERSTTEVYRRIEETPDGGTGPILMEFFWVPLSDVVLFAGLDAFLPQLKARLSL